MKKIFRLILLLPLLILGILGLHTNTSSIAGSLRRLWNYAGAPTSGTSGTFAGSVKPGDLLIDETNGIVYKNINTTASPTWIPVASPPVKTLKTASDATVDIAESGIIEMNADAVYLYLPTYIGNTGLTYLVKCLASFSSGVKVYPYSTGEKIDGAAVKTSTAQYDCLTVVAGSYGWNIVAKVGTWN